MCRELGEYFDVRDAAMALSTLNFVVSALCIAEFAHRVPDTGREDLECVDCNYPWLLTALFTLLTSTLVFSFLTGVLLSFTIAKGLMYLYNASLYAQIVMLFCLLGLVLYYAILSAFWMFAVGLTFWCIIIVMTGVLYNSHPDLEY